VKSKRIIKLPDRPLTGEHYMNGFSEYVVMYLNEDGSLAKVRRPKDGWTCIAHHPALYRMMDGSIQLQWAYSTAGHFAY